MIVIPLFFLYCNSCIFEYFLQKVIKVVIFYKISGLSSTFFYGKNCIIYISDNSIHYNTSTYITEITPTLTYLFLVLNFTIKKRYYHFKKYFREYFNCTINSYSYSIAVISNVLVFILEIVFLFR